MTGQSEWIQGDAKLARRAWMRQTPWSWMIAGALIVLSLAKDPLSFHIGS
ncbi:hypothetical protein [Bifidobacterium vespertilionis]|nr:hypothetical protein [Bifidobacterium vespertilionis]MBT1178925.1 hypothetical protein [Bifidobacterium vespertilionis]